MKKYVSIMLVLLMAIICISCVNEVPESINKATVDKNLVMSSKEAESKTPSIEPQEEKLSEAAQLTKAFYEEFFAQEADNEAAEGRMGNSERLEVVKRKYLTEDLIEELHLRSREQNSDAITNSQDDIPLRGKLKFMNGKDENTGVALYREDFPNGGYIQDTFELHFANIDGSKLADELNVYHQEKDANGNDFNYELKTKFANNGGISEENRIEMEKIKKELDDLEAQGFIG